MVDQISGQGNLSQRVERLFSKADTNGDGSIDQSEFSQLFAKMLAHKGEGAQASSLASNNLFASLDTNGDGTISKDEFAALVQGHKHHHGGHHGLNLASLLTGSSSDAGSIFSAIDSNGDGVISMSELLSYLEAQAAATGGTTTASAATTASATGTASTAGTGSASAV